MFLKLLKHTFRTTWRRLGGLSIGAMGAGALGAAALYMASHPMEGRGAQLVMSLAASLTAAMFAALAAYAVGSGISLYWHYYRNKFSDEGYLTFTLPARGRDIFFSEYVSILLWSAIIGIVTLSSLGVMVLLGTGDYLAREVSDLLPVMDVAFRELGAVFGAGYGAALAVAWLVEVLAQPMLILSCITMGCTFARRHKLLMSVVMYGAFSLVSGMGQTVVALAALAISEALGGGEMTVLTLGQALVSLVLGCAGMGISLHLIQEELNLP